MTCITCLWDDQDIMQRCLPACRKEQAGGVDVVEFSCLRGFCKAEVEPLLRSLELTTIIKTLQHIQELLGGEADPSPVLTGQVDAAVQQLKQAAVCQAGPELPAAEARHGESHSDLDVTAISTAGHGRSGGVVLPARLQSRIPVVAVVQSPPELQQLVNELQRHQVSQEQPAVDACMTLYWLMSGPRCSLQHALPCRASSPGPGSSPALTRLMQLLQPQ
jgi:hypothetical protein